MVCGSLELTEMGTSLSKDGPATTRRRGIEVLNQVSLDPIIWVATPIPLVPMTGFVANCYVIPIPNPQVCKIKIK